ncbi:MAG: hypothetical protein H6704_17060 [Myxococcales bacterium]|nr:hypothetical protein [Myxococcales bacterium]
MASEATRPYAGRAGSTRTVETSVWCGGCGLYFGGRYHLSVDADASPAVLERFLTDGYAGINTMACPDCGWTHVAHEPLIVHHPKARALRLVLPHGQRHRAQQARAALIAEIAGDPGVALPPYALDPTLVVGPEELRDALADGATAPAKTAHAAPTAPTPARGLPPVPRRPTPASAGLPLVGAAGDAEPSAPPPPPPVSPPASEPPGPPLPETHDEDAASIDFAVESVDLEAVASADVSAPPAPATPPLPGKGLLAEILGAGSAAPPPPPVPASDDDAGWDESVDAQWSLDAPAEPAQDDPTHVVAADEVAAPRRPAGPAFDDGKAAGRAAYVERTEDGVRLHVKLDPARATRFEEDEARVWFQLHQPRPGPVMSLLLVRLDAEREPVDHVLWPLDHQSPAHREVLDALASNFAVDVAFHAPDGAFHGRRHLRSPLEANVTAARAQLERVVEAGGVDAAGARAAVQADGYDVLGRLKHNFRRNSFETIASAADARLALGILSYWSAPERRDYLVGVKSFPLVWFDAMTRRVVEGALAFGLSMEPHMRQRAIDLGLADSSAGLLRTSLANFAEVSLNLKPNNLDALDIWDNWEQLLALAEELDLRVDEEIEELAAQAMERAREAAQGGEAIELDPDEASIELADEGELTELTDADLVNLLEDREQRRDAALALLARGDAVFVEALFHAIKSMSREELLAVVPAALSQGPAFETAFLSGLRSRRISLALASALFLAEIRSERAAAPLLALLPGADEPVWPILARAAARMGRRILNPALRQVARDGDPDGRVAYALALLGADARGALSAARAQNEDAKVKACLTTALERMGEASFGDAADFTERLADAFAAAGPDGLGPDFEEALESVDLGPGASLGDIETDVDLDGLDGK